jgi:hypothetical protein
MAKIVGRNNADQQATQLRADVESELQRINAEICAYPAPIPACDAYFNFLLEERGRLSELKAESRAQARRTH